MGHQLLLPILTGGIGLPNVFNIGYNLRLRRRVLVRVPVEDGVGGVITRAQAIKATITRGSGESWVLVLPAYAAARRGFATGWRAQEIRLSGRRAIDLLGKIMPRFNTTGGTRKRVREAVDLIEARPPRDNPAPGRTPRPGGRTAAARAAMAGDRGGGEVGESIAPRHPDYGLTRGDRYSDCRRCTETRPWSTASGAVLPRRPIQQGRWQEGSSRRVRERRRSIRSRNPNPRRTGTSW